MQNDIYTLSKEHEKAANLIYDQVMQNFRKKYILTISGEVATGKCEIAQLLARRLKENGISCKIIHLDDYYLTLPGERNEIRRKNGLDSVGVDEINWSLLNRILRLFKTGQKAVMPSVDLITNQVDEINTDFADIDMVIVAGLYALKAEKSNLNIFIEMSYTETMAEQKAERKEVLDEFRMQVLEQEHKAVRAIKPLADYYIDFATNPEVFYI